MSEKRKIAAIDLETILCTYQGHTIFSIFQENIEVYDQIVSQINHQEFEEEEDFDGQDVENNYQRRLYRILSLPTGDWSSSKQVRENIEDFWEELPQWRQ